MSETVIYEGAETTNTIPNASHVEWKDQYLEVRHHPYAPEWMTEYDELRQYGSETKRIPLARVVEVLEN